MPIPRRRAILARATRERATESHQKASLHFFSALTSWGMSS
jgi:hypothetical protein